MSEKNWRKKIANEGTQFLDHVKGIEEHLLVVARELGACEQGVGADSQLALSELAQALVSLDVLGIMFVEQLEGSTEGCALSAPLQQVPS